MSTGSYTITVGKGGPGGTAYEANTTKGQNSSITGTGFTAITAIGGGGGGWHAPSVVGTGSSGGSGGGGMGGAGEGTAGQGNKGATHANSGNAGGGGAGSVGNTGLATSVGRGGTGKNKSDLAITMDIPSNVLAITTFAKGGDGGYQDRVAGTAHTGNGGSGGYASAGYAGGSGIVIIRYPYAHPDDSQPAVTPVKKFSIWDIFR